MLNKISALVVAMCLCASLSSAATFTFNAKTGKTTLADADIFGIEDSAASFAVKKVTAANLKSYVLTGNAASASVLQDARTIGGVSFNGSANINLPGVNAAGNQNTTGTAAGITGYTIATTVGATGSDTVLVTEQGTREAINALPTVAAGTGITITEDGGGAGIDTINVTANTYQAYDADLTTWAGVTPGTGVGAALAVSAGSVGGFPKIIASGASAMSGSAVAANTCSSAVAVTATGVATTDTIIATPNAQLATVVGYGASTAGALRVDVYPTSGNVNFQVCNPTSASIDPDAITINWRVLR